MRGRGRGPSPDGGDVFSADTVVGGDLAAVDWAATPLGTPDTWPQSLQTAVRILLRSRFSMWMAWGPELTFFCNDAYRRATLGGKYPWALGRPAREVWAEIWDDIGPRIDGVLTTGRATWDEGLLLLLERSGYPEETYHTFSYSSLTDDSGRTVGMLCVVTEETSRVIAERRMATLRDLGSDPALVPSEVQTLETAVARLARNHLDLPFVLVYLVDDDGRARLAARAGLAADHPAAPATIAPENDSAPWPLTRMRDGETVLAELVGPAFADLPTGPWSSPPAHAVVTPLVQQGAVAYGFLVAALNPHRPADDDARGFVALIAAHLAAEIGSARAYAAQQAQAAELLALDRAKTAFFANVSHEFRTPLTLMLGPVTDLLDDDLGAEAHDQLEIVHRNGLRLTKLVNTLLDFARIEDDRVQARFAPVDIAELTADLASGFRSAVERAGLTLSVDCAPVGEPVFVDRDMWEKVMLNLLSNAVKYTRTGTITVGVDREDTTVVVAVADTGVGIPADELPRLFERFHRVTTSWARSYEGSGIGLSLVRELVTMHGGTIAAESTHGVGTTVTIRVPTGRDHLPPDAVVEDPPTPRELGPTTAQAYVAEVLQWSVDGLSAPPTLDPGPTSTPAATPARVLVVDDNADMRSYVRGLLTDARYETAEAADGEQALRIIARQPPDLVLSDVMMPRLDGFGLLAAIRGDPRTQAMPVVLLSARAGPEAAVEGLRAGADDYLVKPFVAADLLARIGATLGLSRLRRHHERWRTALIDALQEAFFVCDEDGVLLEMNSAFTDVLGYGPEGLPYPPRHPWWPSPVTDPGGSALVDAAFADAMAGDRVVRTVPVDHRDGHRLWVSVTVSHTVDPDSGRRILVGTLRDVTEEHYRVRRQTTLSDLTRVLAQAESVDDAVAVGAAVLRDTWDARQVVAVTVASTAGTHDPVRVIAVDASDTTVTTDLTAEMRPLLDAVDEVGLLHPVSTEPGVAAVAVQHPDGVLVLVVELVERRQFSEPDYTLLSVAAGHLGQGLDRVYRVDQERRTAVALQHAILGPSSLPAGFAARYRPASPPLQVGGDWYDVVDLDDGRLGVIVGDCVGHGLEAATVMGQVRSACRALLLTDPAPAAVLTGLDRFADRLPGARCTTVMCAVLDPETGVLRYSSAGHPPAVVLLPDGTSRTLTGGRSIPLGIRPGRPRPEAETVLPARSTLLAYTDGLVERRGRSLDEGIAGAEDALRTADTADDPDGLADHLLTAMRPDRGYPDDVAVLLCRHPAPLSITVPARADELGDLRQALRSWLHRAEVGAEQSGAVLVAAGEAVANAVEHGRADEGSTQITVDAHAVGPDLRVRVADTGTWKAVAERPDPTRGRGIAMIRALTDHTDIRTDRCGTTVEMYVRITG